METEAVVATENDYPKDKYHHALNEIANHRFVTADTLEYRQGMEEWMAGLKEGFAVLGVTECVFIPTGSMAVGMVSKEAGSDIDGKVLYNGPEDLTAIHEFINKVELPEKFNPFLVFSEIKSSIERTATDAQNAVEYKTLHLIDDEAKLFAPTLSEFKDANERKIVDGWRKDVIQRLTDLPEGQGEAAWNMMRQILERQFVLYENSEGGDTEKRKVRVENVLEKGLDNIYRGDERRKAVAKAVIAGARRDFHLPDFKEMQEIFSVVQTEKKEMSENKNVEFYENYLHEPDPDKRLKLATDYLVKDAGDVWLYLYSSLNQEVGKNVEQKEADVDMISAHVNSEKESGEENVYVKNLVKYIDLVNNQFLFKASIESGDIPLDENVKKLFMDEMSKSADVAWHDFEEALDVVPDPELMTWLKGMIDSRKIIVYERKDEKDTLGAAVAYAKTDHLVINPGLIPSKLTGADFLLSLAHERGHFYKNHSDTDVSQMSQGDMVLEEFFAMMEEQRTYAVSGEKFKNSVRNDQLYEMSVDSGQAVVGNNLPNSEITPKFMPGKIALVLFKAYSHALNQLTDSERRRTVMNMLELNKTPDEIKRELERVSVPKPSLLSFAETNWRKEDIAK